MTLLEKIREEGEVTMQNRRGFFATCLAVLPIPFLKKKDRKKLSDKELAFLVTATLQNIKNSETLFFGSGHKLYYVISKNGVKAIPWTA